MPSDPQPPSKGYLHSVLVDGATPFRYRGGVRALLGMPDGETAVALAAVATPPLAFNYAAPHGVAAMYEPGQPLADELLRSTPESAPARTPPDGPGVRPEPAMPHAPETRQLAVEEPETDRQTRTSQMTDPIRQGAADAVASPAAGSIAPAEPLSGGGAIDRQATFVIPGIAERPHTPVRTPSNPVQPQPEETNMATPEAGASTPIGGPEAGRTIFSVSIPAASVSPGRHGDPSHQSESGPAEQLRRATSGPDAHIAADPDHASVPEAGHPTTPAPAPAADTRPGVSSSGSAEWAHQGRSGPDERSRRAFSAAHIAADSAVAGAPEAGLPADSTPLSAASVRPGAGPGSGTPAARSAAGHAGQLGQTARDPTISSAAAQLPAGGSETSSSAAAPQTPAVAARPVGRPSSTNPIEPFRPDGSTPAAGSASGIPVAAAPIPAADARGVGSAGSIYQPARGTAEQIAQLQRTVSDLAAQIAAQQVEQRSDPASPPAAQPVVIVERAAPPARMARAFWERSYLSRLYRWPRR